MNRRLVRILLATVLLGIGGGCSSAAPGQTETASNDVLALVGGTIRPASGASPIRDGVLLIEGGRIAAVGPRDEVRIPLRAVVIDVSGGTVLPGFWNSHVHFTESKWQGIDTVPADQSTASLRQMLTRFGFVHVFDIGSFSEGTLALRRRIERGEVLGPDILTTLAPFVPPNGTPRYVEHLTLPELHDPAGARDSVRVRVVQGADGIKLFTMPITRQRPFPVMDSSIVRAVTDEAHRTGRFVIAHPTHLAGVHVAVENGVDVLAHTVPMAGSIPDSLLDLMVRRGTALIPTLTLWEEDVGPDTAGIGRFVRAGQEQVRGYAQRGGRILFGTDVGYITVYDPTREYELMENAGLGFDAILASLTTAPATVFHRGERTGRLAPGLDADVVVIDGDPAADIRALTRVRLTIKRGLVLYRAADEHQRDVSTSPAGFDPIVP